MTRYARRLALLTPLALTLFALALLAAKPFANPSLAHIQPNMVIPAS
jgi:hypothetical protein